MAFLHLEFSQPWQTTQMRNDAVDPVTSSGNRAIDALTGEKQRALDAHIVATLLQRGTQHMRVLETGELVERGNDKFGHAARLAAATSSAKGRAGACGTTSSLARLPETAF